MSRVPECGDEPGTQQVDAGMRLRARAGARARTTGSCGGAERSGQTEHELLEQRNTRQARANRLRRVRAHLQQSAHAAHEIGHLSAKLLQAAAAVATS